MNLHQAQKLIPYRDYVFFGNKFYKIRDFAGGFFLLDNPGHVPMTVDIESCQLLGEYLGCFDQSVFPPPYESIPGVKPRYSDDVIVQYENGGPMDFAIYDHKKKYWAFRSGFAFGTFGNFKWCFPPAYLTF